MYKFVECEECEFVLRATPEGPPEPMHWETCPDCGETVFTTTGE